MFYDNFLPVNTRLIITGLYQDYLPHILCEIWPPRYLEDLVDWIIYFEPTVIRTHHGTPSPKPPSLYLSKNKNLMFWWPAKVQGASHWINFKKCYIFSKKKKNTLTLAWPLLIFVSFKIRSPHVLIKFQIIISQTLGHLSRLYIVTLSD